MCFSRRVKILVPADTTVHPGVAWRRVQSLIGRGQRAGTFRTDLPDHWLITTTFSLMHAAAEDAAAGRIKPGDAAALITAILQAAFTPPADGHNNP